VEAQPAEATPGVVAKLSERAKGRGRKPLLYSAVSVVAVLTSQITLVICHALIGMGAEWSNIVAVAAGTVPSYELNRSWVWGKTSKSHLWKEVVPFWVLSFVGLVFSTVVVSLAIGWWSDTTLVVQGANLAAFGILWVGKFLLLHYVLFKDHGDHVEQFG
jgi:putative flippase GtrA